MRILLPLAILAAVVLGCAPPKPQTGSTSDAPKTSQPEQPQLELLASRGTREYGYVEVSGQVRNLSSESLDGVEAVIEHYDKDGDFISSDEGMIEYQPVRPGQTSPFKTMGTWNPDMKTFRIKFKTIMGSEIFYVDHSKEKSKSPKK